MTRRRRERAEGEEPMTHRRLYVGKGQTVELDGGGIQSYRGGEFYMVPEELAQGWIDADIAYDPDEPPVCPICGEGTTSYVQEGDKTIGPLELIGRHVASKHPEQVPDVAVEPAAGEP